MRSQDYRTRPGRSFHCAIAGAAAATTTVALALAAASICSTAQAGLFTELRASSVDPAHATVVSIQPDRKHVLLAGPAAVGATITMQLIAKVSGADMNDANDALLSMSGS